MRALSFLALAALVGCGTQTTDDATDDAGTSSADLAVVLDLVMPECTPACTPAAPFCNAQHHCVTCVADADCGVGKVCKVVSPTVSQCVPGCSSDDRCRQGGGGAAMACCQMQCTDTGSDIANCGACGNACTGKNTSASCVGGKCQNGACNAGYGDCNNNPADGCEANLHVDKANCMACGMACNFKNAVSSCADGCYIAACNFGYDDCNSDPGDGCETSVLADAKNCGACGTACGFVSNAQVGCVNAACQIQKCNFGYADCNGTLMDGCEIATASDKANCGQCGKACNQGQVCINSVCTCPPCNFPNAASACVNDNCALGACNEGFGNCDGNANNGCERPISADAANCGACGKVCANGLVCINGGCTCQQCNQPHARTSCVNNNCVLDSCLAGWGDCNKNLLDGCELPLLADPSNCGACGNVCPQNAPYCDKGSCSPGCVPSGQRAAFNALSASTASGCWKGNPCAQDQWAWDSNNGRNFQNTGESVTCSGNATCVGNVGIVTYSGTPTCQGIWNVLCDGVQVGSINSLGAPCVGSAKANACKVSFIPRMCTSIQLVAAPDNDGTSNCCGGNSPDSMLTGVSAW